MKISLWKLNTEYIFIFTMILVPLSLFFNHGYVSVSIMLLVAFSIFSIIRNQNKALTQSFPKALIFPIILLFLYLIGAIYSSNVEEGINLVIRRLPLLVIPVSFILVNQSVKEKLKEYVLFTFFLGTIICSLICIVVAIYNVIKLGTIYFPSDTKFSYLFSYDALTLPVKLDPIYASMFSNLGIIICLETKIISRNIYRFLGVGYLSIFIVLIASKIGILSLIFILVFWFWNRKESKYAILFSTIILIPIIWLGVFKLPFLKERFKIVTNINYSEVDSGKWGSTAFRLAIWDCALTAIKGKPIQGYGTGSGHNKLQEVYQEKNFFRGFTDGYNAHNEFLSTMLDVGIFGVIALLSTLFAGFYQFYKVGDKIGISFILIAFFSLLVESVFFRQKGIVFFSYFYSYLIWRLPINNQIN